MSHVNTFDCFYQKWQTACADAVKIAEVSGNAPFDKGYTCQPVAGTDDYTLQVGPDIANKITINYQAAPRQTPLVEINGTPTEVNGPYPTRTAAKFTPISRAPVNWPCGACSKAVGSCRWFLVFLIHTTGRLWQSATARTLPFTRLFGAQRMLQKVGITWPGSPEIPEEPRRTGRNPFLAQS